MVYIVLKIKNIPRDYKDKEIELANLLPVAGAWDQEDEWHLYFEKKAFEEQKETILKVIKDFLGESISIDMDQFNDEDIDWNEEWKKSYKPIAITENIVIYPSWFEIDPKDQHKIVIKIEPQMGFGTGTHETTQMMLILMEKYIKNKKYLLDMGTGSGILALTSAKMNHSLHVDAIEIDEDALENAKLNGQINNIEGIHWIRGGKESIPNRQYDIILANINRSVLLQLIPTFSQHLNNSGYCILSGILSEEKYWIEKICQKYNWQLIEELNKNEWVGQVWQKLE